MKNQQQENNMSKNKNDKKSLFNKYATGTQKQLLCFSAKVMIQGSTRKSRIIYASNAAIYIIRQDKLRLKIPYALINFIYVAIFSGQILLVSHKDKFIIDNIHMRSVLINIIAAVSKQAKIQYIKSTMLDQTMNKCQYSSQLKDLTSDHKHKNFQTLDLTELKKQYKIKEKILQVNKLKNYGFKGIMIQKDDWFMLQALDSINHRCIIKIYPKRNLNQPFSIQSVFNERNAQEGLNSIFTVNLKKAFSTKSKVCFEFSHFNGVLLSNLDRTHKIFTSKYIPQLIAQIIIGLGEVHQCGLVMVNLQPKRFIITSQGKLLIHDFSYSCPAGRSLSSNLPYSSYYPPEIIKYNYPVAQFQIDWWGLGLLIIWLITGQHIFFDKATKQQLQDVFQKQETNLKKLLGNETYSLINFDALQLINKLLKKEPKSRIGSGNQYNNILKQPYFKDLKLNDIVANNSKTPKVQNIIFKDHKSLIQNDAKCDFDDAQLIKFAYNKDLQSQQEQKAK